MKTIALPKNVEISDDAIYQEIEGESVILNLKTEEYFGLNQIGTRVWQLLSENDETERVIGILTSEYDVKIETLTEDLAELIRGLEQSGLVLVKEV